MDFVFHCRRQGLCQYFAIRLFLEPHICFGLCYLVSESEQTEYLDAGVAAYKDTVKKNASKREREEALIKKKLKQVVRPSLTSLQGKTVYCAPSLASCNMLDRLAALQVTRCTDPRDADFLLFDDPSELDTLTGLCAKMRGLWLLNSVAIHNENAGAWIKYKPAFAIRRALWISDAFHAEHPALANFITDDIHDPRRKTSWTLLRDVQAVVNRKQAADKKKCTSTVVALVTVVT